MAPGGGRLIAADVEVGPVKFEADWYDIGLAVGTYRCDSSQWLGADERNLGIGELVTSEPFCPVLTVVAAIARHRRMRR